MSARSEERAGGAAAVDGADIPRALGASAAAPAPAVFTVDVEDYYQVAAFRGLVRRRDWDWYPSRVEGNVARLLDLCDEHGIVGMWFILGWEAERRPEMVRRIAARGHELGCHSYWHREIYNLAPEEFREDTRRAKAAIEDAAGRAVVGYRAPSFSITKRSLWALDILVECGFTFDSSIFPVRHPNYGIPDAPHYPHRLRTASGGIWELPPATAPLCGRRVAVAGGGYLRQFPFSFVRAGLDRLTRGERHPAVLYVHPWEIDPGQPRLAAGWLTRQRHYRSLGRMSGRLATLLGALQFCSASALVRECRKTPGAAAMPAEATHRPEPARGAEGAQGVAGSIE